MTTLRPLFLHIDRNKKVKSVSWFSYFGDTHIDFSADGTAVMTRKMGVRKNKVEKTIMTFSEAREHQCFKPCQITYY